MNNLIPPPNFCFNGNIAEAWKRWKKQYEIYALASGVVNEDENVQAAVFLHVLGCEGQEKIEALNLDEAQKSDVSELIQALEKICVPKSNETVSRHLFFNCSQKQGETFEEFLMELKKLSVNCNFGNLKDSLIKDRIISGVLDSSLRDRLLKEDTLELEKCINLCQLYENTKRQIQTLKGSEVDVDVVKNVPNRTFRVKPKQPENSFKNSFHFSQQQTKKFSGNSNEC